MTAPSIARTCREAAHLPPLARLAMVYLRHEHGRGSWAAKTLELEVGLSRQTASAVVAALVDDGLARQAPEAGPARYVLTTRGGAA